MVVHLKAQFPMNRELDLSAISGKEKQTLHFHGVVFFIVYKPRKVALP